MQAYFSVLSQSPLFSGINPQELQSMLDCLAAQRQAFEKGEVIFSPGDPVLHIGVVLRGMVYIVQEDYWGNRGILAAIGPGELFGEAFSCAGEASAVGAEAAQDCEMLRIDCRRIITLCPSACAFHSRLMENLMQILARKNILLTQKMEIVSRRTTREKLLAFLSAQALSQGAREFSIPFNRQELADYLGVDRSAMSAELSRMRREGLLAFQRNHFSLMEHVHV